MANTFTGHKSRDISFDIIRITACFLVVLMHSPIPSEHAVGPFLTALSYVTAPCIGLFFMLSGALLLPTREPMFRFLKRRLGKIVVPTVVWSLIYILLKLYNSESEITLIRSLASMPFSAQGEGVLWFVYTLLGLYLLAPIISAWLEKATKREIEFLLLLWVITLLYPVFDCFLTINTTPQGILYYFTGYAGYFLLGYYLQRFPKVLNCGVCWAIALAGMALIGLLKYNNIDFDFYALFWYLSIFVATFCSAIWLSTRMLCKLLVFNTLGGVRRISNLTFGIYLVHILIMRHWLWQQSWIERIENYPIQTLLVAIITFMISAALCWLISKAPFSKWVIGYNSPSNTPKG